MYKQKQISAGKSLINWLFIAAFAFSGNTLRAQDVITLRTGEDIIARIEEVGRTEVRYKRFDNLQGPTFVVEIARIFMITYENGSRDVFNPNPIGQHLGRQQSYKHPALSWGLSFLVPGVGQFYNGDIGKGFIFLGASIVGNFFMIGSTTFWAIWEHGYRYTNEGPLAIGLIVYLGSWIWAQIDAPISAVNKNRAHGFLSWDVGSNDAFIALQPEFNFTPISINQVAPTYGLGLNLRF